MSLNKMSSFGGKVVSHTIATVLFTSVMTPLLGVQPASAFDRPAVDVSRANDHPIVIHWTHCADIVTAGDRDRLSAIQTVIERRHVISDSDLAFVVGKLRGEPIETKGDNKLTLQCMVLTSLVGRKDVTKPQAAKLLEAIAPFTTSYNSSVAFYATTTLSGVRDAHVIPLLERVASTAVAPNVRKAAMRGLPRLRELAKVGEI